MTISLAAFVKKARKRKKLTQKGLAVKMGLKRGAVWSWENGVKNPSIDSSKKMGEFFGFDWRDFFDNSVMIRS